MITIWVSARRCSIYWDHDWNGESAYETGYGILPEFQGRGLAVAVADKARADGRHRFLYASPSIDHAASNAVCRKAGFTLQLRERRD